jgi:ATP-dependent DNA helicase DinG
VVLTSATLAVAGGFEFVQKAAGVAQARTLVVCPAISIIRNRRCCTCRRPARSAQSRLHQGGGATRSSIADAQPRPRVRSVHQLSADAPDLRSRFARIRIQTLLQGTGPRSALLDEFRATPNCVLFATSSFWQGVDVPGEQLSCVIIDKLPFAVPSDPVVEARVRNARTRAAMRSTIIRCRRRPSR